MIDKQKRKPRTYKATNEAYESARKRAKKDKSNLSNIIENVVTAYAAGWDVKAVRVGNGGGHAIDIFTEDFSIKLTKANQRFK